MAKSRQRLGEIILTRWADAASRLAIWIAVGMLIATVGAAYYTVKHVAINTNTEDMLSPKLPFRIAYEKYKKAFPQEVDDLVLVIDGDTPESAQGAAKALAARLRKDSKFIKTVYTPTISPFFDKNGLLYLDVPKLNNLINNLSTIQPYLGKFILNPSLTGLLSMLTSGLDAVEKGTNVDLEPVLQRLDVATRAALKGQYFTVSWEDLMFKGESNFSQNRQIILVQPYLDYSRFFFAAPAINDIRQIASELNIDEAHGLRLRMTGELAMSYEELKTVTTGMGIVAGVALTMVVVVLYLGLRSIRLMLTTLAVLIAGLLFTAAFATAAVGELNLISIAFAVLFIGLGVDYGIHLCLRVRELNLRHRDSLWAVRGAARDVGISLALCAATTAVGFYSFIPTLYAGVSELGIISGTGMFISLVVTLTLVPALLRLWPQPEGERTAISEHPVPRRIAELPVRHGRAVRVAAAVAAVIGILSLPFVRFDYNPINLRNQHTESVETFKELVKSSKTPPLAAYVLAPNLVTVQAEEVRLTRLSSVKDVVSILDFIPKYQQEKLSLIQELSLILGPQLSMPIAETQLSVQAQNKAVADFIGTLNAYLASSVNVRWADTVKSLKADLSELHERVSKGEGSLITTLQHSLLATLPAVIERLSKLLTAAPVTIANLPSDLKAHWISKNGIYKIEVYPRSDLTNNVALREFVTQVQAVVPDATGFPMVSYEAGSAVVRAFQEAFGIALVAITALLLLLQRSVIDTILVLVPLLLASVFTAALTVFLDIPFNFANIIALPLLLGIGVDNGIHMMHRLRAGIPADKLLTTSTSRAVLFSGLTTMLSFGSLALSFHPGMSSMGAVLIIGTALTLIATLIILPALVTLQRRR